MCDKLRDLETSTFRTVASRITRGLLLAVAAERIASHLDEFRTYLEATRWSGVTVGISGSRLDLAPKFYPVLSSPRLLDLPGWTVAAAGAGAEPSA